eukprot:gene26959-35373_t
MLPTNQIPIISSIHGRERRQQRDITKRDLQAAIKYGTKEAQYRLGKLRWKYTFADVVYITDETSTVEVTSYAVELALTPVVITERMNIQLKEARDRIGKNSKIITSHMVLIVDMSTSMSMADMNGHRSRARGVYYTIAEDVISVRLHPPEFGKIGGDNTTFTDVVTLIEMRSGATVVFEREPISWQLYNRFCSLREEQLTKQHGNYYPSFQSAFSILRAHLSDLNCALCIFFFSDGAPSDFSTSSKLYLPEEYHFPNNLNSLVRNECSLYRSRLTLTAFGFGKSSTNFSVMQSMIDIARQEGVKASFGQSAFDPSDLRTLLSSTVTSLTETRTLLSRLTLASSDAPRQKVVAEKEIFVPSSASLFDAEDWEFFVPTTAININRVDLIFYQESNGSYKGKWEMIPFAEKHSAVGFAVGKKYFGEGAERVVYKMTEVNARNEAIGPALVAKESFYQHKKQDACHLERWHRTFIKTQRKASTLAGKFNAKLDTLGVDKMIYRVKFLSCSIYNAKVGGKCVSYLAEKQLDPNKYLKYNNNAGGVDGNAQQNAKAFEIPHLPHLPVDLKATPAKKLGVINEDEEDDEEDSDGEADAPLPALLASAQTMALQSKVFDGDIPQAFTHWTYSYTKREMMVCDLQGQLNMEGYFELTDPCIHSQTQKYGRTDHGATGFRLFFNSHQCNHLCKILSIANDSYQG